MYPLYPLLKVQLPPYFRQMVYVGGPRGQMEGSIGARRWASHFIRFECFRPRRHFDISSSLFLWGDELGGDRPRAFAGFTLYQPPAVVSTPTLTGLWSALCPPPPWCLLFTTAAVLGGWELGRGLQSYFLGCLSWQARGWGGTHPSFAPCFS